MWQKPRGRVVNASIDAGNTRVTQWRDICYW
jgi:hypothetical protein